MNIDVLKHEFQRVANIIFNDILENFKDAKTEKKHDKTLISDVDKDISKIVLDFAQSHSIGIFDEEYHDKADIGSGLVIVSDPLDGSRELLFGLEAFGPSIAILNDGDVICSHISAPLLGERIDYCDGIAEHTRYIGTANQKSHIITPRTKDLDFGDGAYIYVDPPLNGICGQHKGSDEHPELNYKCDWASVVSSLRLSSRQRGASIVEANAAGIAGYAFKSMPHDLLASFPIFKQAGLKIFDICNDEEVKTVSNDMFDEDTYRLKNAWLVCNEKDYPWLSKHLITQVIPHQFEGKIRQSFLDFGINSGMLVKENVEAMKLAKHKQHLLPKI